MVTGDKLVDCPALTAIRVVSGMWKTRILWLLRDRPHHFGELRAVLPGVSAKVLSEQLSQLAADGVVASAVEMRKGVAHRVYRYSDYGRTLVPVLEAMGNWGLAHEGRGEAR